MTEIVLTNKKFGMLMLFVLILMIPVLGFLFLLGVGLESGILTFLSILLFVFDMIGFAGLKILRPQEGLVLTLFGKYYGTLKGEGFYFVNPFCTAVNPAAATKLNQSGDVDSGKGGASILLKAEGLTAHANSIAVRFS